MNVTLALAQLNLWVGDIEGNTSKVIAAALDARDRLGASLVATPELALMGYPPDDLLLRSALPAKLEEAVARLKAEVQGITLVVGLPEFADDAIYNSAFVIEGGEVIARYRKQHLPNYGVFDDRRHYRPGFAPCVFAHRGKHVGVTICEDIWLPQPAAQARDAGAELLINLNASPYEMGKPAARAATLRARVAETGLPILYVNCVGGQDEVVYDGNSCALRADGSTACAAPLWEEGVYPVHLEQGRLEGEVAAMPASIEAEVYQGLVTATRDYVNRNGFPGVVLGLSGGVDSALVAAIAADAIGPERVWGVSLPSRYTLGMSNDDARIEAEALGIRYSVLPIEDCFNAFNATLAATFVGKKVDLTEENLQSRSRGVLLMALSNKFGHMVLTTGNKSEMAVGYATLYGDMCGGFAPIKDLYKTLVYRLCRYRNGLGAVIPERVLTRAPSAELRENQTDQDSLPPYEVLDAVLARYVEHSQSIDEIIEAGFEEATVRRVAQLVRRSEYKRRQSAPGPKITACAFGRERRYPITAVYGDL